MIMIVINTLCALVFVGIGIFAIRKETPMWFYSGSEEQIEQEDFHDVKDYNRKNGMMWMTYGICVFLVPLLGWLLRFTTPVFLISYLGVLIGGGILMAVYWNHLHKVYTRLSHE